MTPALTAAPRENVIPLPAIEARPMPAKTAFDLFGIVFGLSMAYAIVRYVVAGNVTPDQIPLYIVNKALSLSSVILIALSMAMGPLARAGLGVSRRRLPQRKSIGLIGFGGAAIHAVISLILMGPVYYPKFYILADGPRLTGLAQMAFLCSVGALAILAVLAATSMDGVRKAMPGAEWKRIHRHGAIALSLVGGHLVFIGAKAWFAPATWTAGLPPITLVAFVPLALALAARALPSASLGFLRGRRRELSSQS